MRHDVGGEAEFEVGAVRRVEVDGLGIVVSRISDDRFIALRDVCAHQGARLSSGRLCARVSATGVGAYVIDEDDPVLRCPWHAYEFDTKTGRCLAAPDTIRVRSYPVSLEAGRVYVER